MPVRALLELRSARYSPRVVFLTGARVRVGRGRDCDVRLQGEGVRGVYCTLRRRWGCWSIEPRRADVTIVMDGIRILEPAALPVDTPVLVGNEELRLRLEVAYNTPFSSRAAIRPIDPDSSTLSPGKSPPAGLLPDSMCSTQGDTNRCRVRYEQAVARRDRWTRVVGSMEQLVHTRRTSKTYSPSGSQVSGKVPSERKQVWCEYERSSIAADLDASLEVSERSFHRASEEADSWMRLESNRGSLGPVKSIPQQSCCPSMPNRLMVLRGSQASLCHHDAAFKVIHAVSDSPHLWVVTDVPSTGKCQSLHNETLSCLLRPSAATENVDRPTTMEVPGSVDPRSGGTPDPPSSCSDDLDRRRLTERVCMVRTSSNQRALSNDVVIGEADSSARDSTLGNFTPRSRAFPLASEILKSCGYTGPVTERLLAVERQPLDDESLDASGPRVLCIPLWIWLPPVLAGLLLVGSTGIGLAWVWASDLRAANKLASEMTNRSDRDLFVETSGHFGVWWATTAEHLYTRALALHFQTNSHNDVNATNEMLDLAAQASPLHTLVQLSRIISNDELGNAVEPASRDVLSMAYAARQAFASGQVDLAWSYVREGIALAVHAEPRLDGCAAPASDKGTGRFRLPGEELFEALFVPCVLTQTDSLDRLLDELPPDGVAWLALYRLLCEMERKEATTVLACLLALPDRPGLSNSSGVHCAAKAEALAISRRWREALDAYRASIGLIKDPGLRAVLWANAMDIASEADDASAIQEARREARALATRLRLSGLMGNLRNRDR
jgi:hypothetical protein